MGEKLLKYYALVEKEKGLPGKVELAKLTKVGSIIAAGHPDAPETVQKFRDALKKILGKEPPLV